MGERCPGLLFERGKHIQCAHIGLRKQGIQRFESFPELSWSHLSFSGFLLGGKRIGHRPQRGRCRCQLDHQVGQLAQEVGVGCFPDRRFDVGSLLLQGLWLTLKASAQNVTNKETLTCYDATNCWIGRDRTFQVGASYSF